MMLLVGNGRESLVGLEMERDEERLKWESSRWWLRGREGSSGSFEWFRRQQRSEESRALPPVHKDMKEQSDSR